MYIIVKKEFNLFADNRPWSPMSAKDDQQTDLVEALETVVEWGVNKLGLPRLNKKLGIYVQEDDYLIDQESCFSLLTILELAHKKYFETGD